MPMVATKAPYTLFIVNDDMPENPREDSDNFGHMICFHSRYRIGDEHKYDDTNELFADMIRHSVPDKDIIAFTKDGNAETAKLEYNRSSHEWELNVYSDFFKKWYTEFSAPGPLESIPDIADTILENMKGQEMLPLAEKSDCILPVYLYDHSGLTINTTGFTCPWDSGQIGWIYASHEQVKAEYGAVTPENLRKPIAYWRVKLSYMIITSQTSATAFSYLRVMWKRIVVGAFLVKSVMCRMQLKNICRMSARVLLRTYSIAMMM
jgi:hypothetical protein